MKNAFHSLHSFKMLFASDLMLSKVYDLLRGRSPLNAFAKHFYSLRFASLKQFFLLWCTTKRLGGVQGPLLLAALCFAQTFYYKIHVLTLAALLSLLLKILCSLTCSLCFTQFTCSHTHFTRFAPSFKQLLLALLVNTRYATLCSNNRRKLTLAPQVFL